MSIPKSAKRYKNPERYIRQLQKKLNRLQSDISSLVEENGILLKENNSLKKNVYGDLWFIYEPDVTHSVSFVNDSLEKSKLGNVGDEVVILGTITKIVQSADENEASAEFHTHTVYLKKKS